MIDLKPACGRMIDTLAGVADGQLASPTPCAEYTIGDLIDHIDAVSQGFVAVARKDAGESTDTDTRLEPANLDDDWRENVAKHVWTLGEAWSDPAGEVGAR